MEWYSIAPKHGKCMDKLANGDPCPLAATVTNEQPGPNYIQVCGGHFTCDVEKRLRKGPQAERDA